MDKETQNKVEEECVEKIKSTHEDCLYFKKNADIQSQFILFFQTT